MTTRKSISNTVTTSEGRLRKAAQYELKDPPSDAISAIQFAPTSLRLLVASWDKHVYLYDTSTTGGQLLNKYEHRAPVLDAIFGEDENVAYTAGLDWDVRRCVFRRPMSKAAAHELLESILRLVPRQSFRHITRV